MSESASQTIILGGGFTGLFTALYLSHQHYSERIILIDPSEHFVFRPLLFEFLNGQMDTEQVCPRYQELLQGSGVTFMQEMAEGIDLEERKVKLNSGSTYPYKQLVLALGSTSGYFGTPGAAEYSFTFRRRQDALALRQHLLQALQRASQSEDSQLRRKLLTVAIVGAGPTGVELAATLADWLPAWYAELGGNSQEVHVVLMNRSQEILSGDVNTRLNQTAHTALKQRTIPVELLMNAPVTALHPGEVEYRHNGQYTILEAETIVWTGGTATNPLMKTLSIAEKHRDKHGRPLITPTLQLMDNPEVFAGGDCAALQKSEPALAQVAYQQAKTIAHNLIATSKGALPEVSHVTLRGTLMKLGAEEGAAEIYDKYEIKGRVGHMVRTLTYLEMLPTSVHNLKVTAKWLGDEVVHYAESGGS
jgi:demethylphylloquinone reductase